MQRFFISRLLERFFTRWWLYAIPPLLFVAIGAGTVMQASVPYRSSGVLRVADQTMLSEMTSVRGGSSFGYETPATFTASEINTLLGTDLFTRSVIEAAGLTAAVDSGAFPIDELRGAIWAAPSGDFLVRVNSTSEDSEVAFRLASATIKSYLQWQVDDNVSDSKSAETFFQSLISPYEERLTEARDALGAYVAARPVTDERLRAVDEQIEIQSLTDDVERANDQLSTATQSLAEAQLATAQTSTDIAQRLRIVDSPQRPLAPEPHLRDDAITIMLYAVVGSLVAIAALVLATLTDHSVRYSEEVENRLQSDVLATIPNSRAAISPPTI